MDQNEPARSPAAGPVEERLADILTTREGPVASHLGNVLRQLSDLDRAIYTAIAETPTPDLDGPLRRLSESADNSRLWLGIAAGLAVFGGPAGRHAAARGILSVGVTSAVVNIGIKSVYRRRRPDRAGAGVPQGRYVEMPSSRSFPSGHSASAFAFAGSVGQDLPALALPLRFLALAVAYSRVHTGVHYPGDAVIGSIVGASVAQAIAGLTENAVDTAWRRRKPSSGRGDATDPAAS
jgi:membrane-associated phospholipid phosphatase